MNDRAKQILQLLVKNPDFKVIDLSKRMNLSRRQIDYSLTQINNWLIEIKAKPIEKNNDGYLIVSDETKAVLFSQSGINELLLYSENERVDLLCLYILVIEEEISINHLTDFLQVSKNTVLKDLKLLDQYAAFNNLQLVYTRKDGYQIIGNEIHIRSVLEDIIERSLKNKRNLNIFESFFTIKKDYIVHLIREVETSLNTSYSDASFDFMTYLFLFVFNRIRSTNIFLKISKMNVIRNTKEYALIKYILSGTFIEKEADWITTEFISSNMFIGEEYSINSDENELYGLVHNMVNEFQSRTLVDIPDFKHFVMRLYNHIRPACFRILFENKIRFYSIEQNTIHINILKNLVSELIIPIEKYIQKSFPEDELELLTLYFGSQVNKEFIIPKPKVKAVVVCENGLIVSKMMLEILSRLFPEIHFLTALSKREFKMFESDYQLVFSTNIMETDIPQYIINPIMTETEQIKLRHRVINELNLESNNQTEQLIKIIEKHTQINNYDALRKDIDYHLIGLSNTDQPKKYFPKLDYYLKKDLIQTTNREFDWKEAIKYSFKPMLKSGMITDNYINKTILQYESESNYHYFGRRTAIPHVDSVDDIEKEFIGITIFKKPIKFPNNELISIISPIAIIDSSRHLLAMKELADFMMNEKNIDELLNHKELSKIYKKVLKRG